MWSSTSVDLGMERAALVEVGRVKTVHSDVWRVG